MVHPTRAAVVAGKYQLLEEIGRGGMGAIWRARALHLNMDCALKMVLPHHKLDGTHQLRLFREARIAAKLRSPYVVTIYDVGQWEGGAFIAMELLEGESLKSRLQRERILPTSDLLTLARQIALGLDKAHGAGLVHRDLKPDNLFVVQPDPLLVKILDFGIAKDLNVTSSNPLATATGAITGTPQYMSPEQVNAQKDVDYRSDLWSLALICFECLTGRPPFTGSTLPQLLLNIVSGPIPVPSSIRAALPPELDAWWARAANRDPLRRPQSAIALSEGLRSALLQDESSRSGVWLTDEVSSAARGRRRTIRRAAIAAGVCASLGSAGYALHVLRPPAAASPTASEARGAGDAGGSPHVHATSDAPRNAVETTPVEPQLAASLGTEPTGSPVSHREPDPVSAAGAPGAAKNELTTAIGPMPTAAPATVAPASARPRRFQAAPVASPANGPAVSSGRPRPTYDDELGF
jgi:serine/threonine-protein kinase